MNIIALEGKGNSGKTTVLNIVLAELVKSSSSNVKAAQKIPRKIGGDAREILIINGKKVGIETQGDPGSRLADSLKLFVKEGCELIVCATRTSGSTVDLVNQYVPPYGISWRSQSVLSKASLRHESNTFITNLIVKEALSYL